MIPAPGLTTALAGPHQRTTRLTTISRTGVLGPDLPLTDGEVTLDAGSDTRRTLRATIPGDAWLPRTPDHPLSALGQSVRCRTTIRAAGGDQWTLDLGRFWITTTTPRRPDTTTEIVAEDASAILRGVQLAAPLTPKKAETAQALILRVLAREKVGAWVPSASWHGWSTRAVAGAGAWEVGATVWQVVTEAAAAVGCGAWFDRAGVLQVAPVAEDGVTPTTVHHELRPGRGGTLVSYTTPGTREGAATEVVVRIEPSGSSKAKPVTGRAVATGVLAQPGVGRIVRTEVLQATTPSQQVADDRAVRRLRRWAGLLSRPTVECVPAPHIEPGDGLRLVLADGTHVTHVVQAATHPLGVEGTTRLDCVADYTPDPATWAVTAG